MASSAYKMIVSFVSSFTRLWTWWKLASSFCVMKALLAVLSWTMGKVLALLVEFLFVVI
jgi:hypothetical protein